MHSILFDHNIAALARRQHGVVNRGQCAVAGGTRKMVEHRVATGAWVRLGPGVYAMASAPPTWLRALAAAQLSTPDAAVAGKAAAALHGFEGFRPGHPAITIPAGANVRNALATVHQLTNPHLTVVEGIRVLTPIDSLFHVAGLAPADRTRLAFDQLLASRRLRVEDVAQRFLEFEPGRRSGIALMRTLLVARLEDGYSPPASVLESLLYDILDLPGMPAYIRQHPLPGAESGAWVDAAILSSRLIIEADGRTWHTRVRDFARDRQRDRTAAAQGYRTLRFTYDELRHPAQVAADILAAHHWKAA